MLFAVNFADKRDQFDTRKENLQSHIRWPDDHKEVVFIGGSLREEPDANPIGRLWIVEAESKLTIEALIRTDPFWVHGLRDTYRILHWSKAFPDRKTPV
ncbi:MAG: YciI family protein [Arenicellales bacterium]